MNLAIHNSKFDGNGMIWAIIASILLHVLIAVFVPNIDFSTPKEKRQVLKIELQQPAPPAPAPIIEPLPPIEIPEPPKPKPVKKKPIIKPKPIKKEIPKPIEEPEITPPPVVEEVVPTQPTIETEPEEVPPQPPATIEPPPPEPVENVPLGPSDAELRAARDSYKSAILELVKNKVKRSKLAERRGYEGKTIIKLMINSNGEVTNTYLCKSSGHDALDRSALKGFKSLTNLPLPKYLQVFSLPDNQNTTCTEDIPKEKDGHGFKIPIVFKNRN